MYRKRSFGASVLALSAAYACAEPIFSTPSLSGVVSEGSNRSFDMSPDGRFVLFTADGDDMAPGDSNGVVDLVLMDRSTNTSEVISVGFTPPQQGGVNYYTGAVSADGRYVAFTTSRDRPSGGQVELAYVRDRVTQQTRLVSTNDAGDPLEESAMNVAISDDGRYVAFTSTAPSILEGQDPPRHFLVDLQTGERRIVSRNRGGAATAIVGTPGYLSMSGDGRWVVFSALSLLPSLPPDTPGIYLYDRDDDSIVLMNRTAAGDLAQGEMESPKISRDGRYIAFPTNATALTGRPQNEVHFVRKDRASGAVAPIDIDDQGQPYPGNVLATSAPFHYLSPTGRFFAFQSPRVLIPGLIDPLGEDPTYVRDMESNRIVVANMNRLGGRERAIGPLSSDGFMLMTAGGPMYPSNLSVPDGKKFRIIVGDAFLQDISPIDVRAQASQVAGKWEVTLTLDNLSTLQATLMLVRLTSTPALELGNAIPDAVPDLCRNRFVPIDCYIRLIPGGQQTQVKYFFISNPNIASANLQFTVATNEPDSNTANNTVNVTLVNPTPPPPPPPPPAPPTSGGGGGGGGTLGWLEIAALAAALSLLRACLKRRPQ